MKYFMVVQGPLAFISPCQMRYELPEEDSSSKEEEEEESYNSRAVEEQEQKGQADLEPPWKMGTDGDRAGSHGKSCS